MKELSREHSILQEIMSDGERLKNIYRFISQNSKFSLRESTQIITERENVTNCCSIDEWNEMGRRVKRGSRGIRYYDSEGKKNYVFDVSDTYGKEYFRRDILPLKHILKGFEELNGEEVFPMRNDYQILFRRNEYVVIELQHSIPNITPCFCITEHFPIGSTSPIYRAFPNRAT